MTLDIENNTDIKSNSFKKINTEVSKKKRLMNIIKFNDAFFFLYGIEKTLLIE